MFQQKIMVFVLSIEFKFNPLVDLVFFFFNDTATTEIYTLSYIFPYTTLFRSQAPAGRSKLTCAWRALRKTELGQRRALQRSEEHTSELQSHSEISYAVLCLKKKKKKKKKKNNDNIYLKQKKNKPNNKN